MSRVISELAWAQLCSRPRSIPKQRKRRGAKAYGLRYEESLAKALPFALHGQWFEFRDANGQGHCQTDFLMRVAEQSIIIEAKLTDIEQARLQLRYLYEPIIERAFGEKPLGIVVVRHLSDLKSIQSRFMVYDSLKSAILGGLAEPTRLAIWHWRERTPILLGNLGPQPPIPRRLTLNVA